ncbi:translation initiation factor eIF 4e-like domain-containing protein [Gongronella butleri]|nr:translation initiation factor eIF 4e-like domain-containing protein [Gongronella butleri]
MHAAELPLPRPVAFYFSDTSKQHHRHGGKSQYRDAVRRVCECATVWQFCARWRYQQQHLGYHPSRLPDHRTLYCFVDGVEPAWEDPVNKHGGRLALAINDRSQIDLLWDWILASFVGGNLDDHGIVGIVAARRYRGDRIEIWFDKTASDNTMPAFK